MLMGPHRGPHPLVGMGARGGGEKDVLLRWAWKEQAMKFRSGVGGTELNERSGNVLENKGTLRKA